MRKHWSRLSRHGLALGIADVFGKQSWILVLASLHTRHKKLHDGKTELVPFACHSKKILMIEPRSLWYVLKTDFFSNQFGSHRTPNIQNTITVFDQVRNNILSENV